MVKPHGKRSESHHKRSDSHRKHKPHGKRHKHRHRKHPRHHASRHGTLPIRLPVTSASPPAPSAAPVATHEATLTLADAHRLLWRAGFGPQPGAAQSLVGQTVQQAVFALTRPSGPAVLNGPEPVDEEGNPLDPYDVWGDDHCWWLDRMIRSDQPLVERMTYIFHDWFANSNEKVDSQRMMLEQNELFRSMCFGGFHELFLAVTANPAMLVFLDGIYNEKHNPNENYAREMMELFSLGADRGAYTQEDVKEMARVLTGWTAEWSEEGLHEFEFDTARHDKTEKTLSAAFGTSGNPLKGNWNWEDAVRLCVEHPLHASFFVTKLWGYFIPSPPDEATLASLQGLYVSSGYSIRAVLEAILQHPDFYEGAELVTPPVVYNAGLLRAIGRPIDTNAWAWMSANAGQQLFYPPNVSGWDFGAWLDTSTTRARWEMASAVTAKTYENPWPQEGEPQYSETEEPAAALVSAMSYWGDPLLCSESSECIARFAETCPVGTSKTQWELSPYRAMRQNALRMLIATAPDMQVS
ncbi:MAG TPA: DUF1800 domain-containing protein [Solirubrobacteraceae bacterium]|jgi:hypothetical protein|nr:DUF1800 domain-containing protein [Solirubrobacteraceae bacterium]